MQLELWPACQSKAASGQAETAVQPCTVPGIDCHTPSWTRLAETSPEQASSRPYEYGLYLQVRVLGPLAG
jgi:hypothetical protein